MSFSAKCQYAFLAMLEIARHEGSNQPVQMRRIAERHGIPATFLVQILHELKRAGLVTSVRGAGGGYRLAASAEALTLADVADVVEGSDPQPTCSAGGSPLAGVLTDLSAEVAEDRRSRLAGLSLSDLLDRAATPMWYI